MILEGKIALVVGGSSGIGQTTALAFAKAGAKVVIAARRRKESEETLDQIRTMGGEGSFIQADMAVSSDVEAMVQGVIAQYGRLDCAFNNAGITGPEKRTADYSEEEWQKVLEVNLNGVWRCMKYEIPQMLKQGGGAIVNMASVLGMTSIANASAYVASKHAVVGLTKTAAVEYARDGVRINAVCPGYIWTPMLETTLGTDPRIAKGLARSKPIKRLGTTDEIANAVVWMCSDLASFMVGHALVVDGGLLAGKVTD